MALNKSEEWEVLAHCPKCGKVTPMTFHTDNHERDSSSDTYTCLECEKTFFPSYGDDIREYYGEDDE